MFLEILAIIILIILNGCFVMSELVIFSAHKPILKNKATEGNKHTALMLAKNTSKFLSIVQIGITSIDILAGAFSAATLSYKLANILIM
ncbi:MAG: CNNM domain-containing protein [Rickettsiales endosymbiont of Dermacentor nuttalli]